MPILLVKPASSYDIFARAKRNSASQFRESAGECIHIGLINNMPDGALEGTERQFLSLLGSAANSIMVKLSLYSLPDIPRNESARCHVGRFYFSIQDLWNSHLDGLIVTGTEPRTSNLKDEPYWGSLTKVIEWAEHNTYSTVWSCLAAHAALLHTDGIGRQRLGDKRFGVFECALASDHPLTSGLPASLHMPHSRWNDISENELTECGYDVLTRVKDRGVDAFVKRRRSLSVFFQGHPEYDVDTLLLEYYRDAGRYLRGKRETYPAMPEGYFDRESADAFTTLRERALLSRSEELIADFPAVLAEKRLANTWRPAAARIYGNWLTYLCEQKQRGLKERQAWKHLQRRETGLARSLPRAEIT